MVGNGPLQVVYRVKHNSINCQQLLTTGDEGGGGLPQYPRTVPCYYCVIAAQNPPRPHPNKIKQLLVPMRPALYRN